MGKMNPEWEYIHGTREWGAYPSETVIRFVARNYGDVKDRKTVRILDFGCGQGANTWYLAREGFDTYAFDGSKSAVKKTIQRLEKEGLEASVSVCEGVEIQYVPGYFDAIIDNVCIYANLTADIKKMYQCIYDILKPAGKLLTVCFGEKCSGVLTGEEIEPHTYRNIVEGNLKHAGIQHIFDQNEIIEILKQSGFKNISCDMLMISDRGYINHQYICTGEK